MLGHGNTRSGSLVTDEEAKNQPALVEWSQGLMDYWIGLMGNDW
jgi:hypothetical protein